MTSFCRIPSPIDDLIAVTDGRALVGLFMQEHKGKDPIRIGWADDPAHSVWAIARRQLAEYFAGERQEFDIPLAATGTDFQRQVWDQLQQIPYGTTTSYGELAKKLGNPGTDLPR